MTAAEYGEQRLYLAILALATGDADLRVRMSHAWPDLLMSVFSPAHWPSQEIWQEYLSLLEDSGRLGVLGAEPLAVPEEEARQLAERLVGLFWTVARQGTRVPMPALA
jgi:hypothetical protein